MRCVADKRIQKTYREQDLADLARQIRVKAGKSQKEVAIELGVSAPAVSNAESKPERSLFQLRKRIIEKYSDFKLLGPDYHLVKK